MENPAPIKLPLLFMSARADEMQMTRLFVAGLQSGVRGFDTAREYRAEKSVGMALKAALAETGVERKDIFVQSRISNEEILRGNIRDEVMRSVETIGLDYLDSFMFHWPTPDVYVGAWRKLTDVYENDNVIKSIGICNVRQRHIQRMIDAHVDMLPQIVQVEVTPFWQVKVLKEFCDNHAIAMQAFSPLCKMIEPVRDNPVLKRLAAAYNVSVPQIILRWNVQRGIAPISMTSRVSRVKENFDIMSFYLSELDMRLISEQDCGYKYHLESATCVGF